MKPPMISRKIEWIVEVDNEPVGIAALVGLDWMNRRAQPQLGFLNTRRAKDIVKASAMMLDFGFNKIAFKKATSHVYEYNSKSQKYTLHIGFKEEGFLHSHVYNPKTKMRIGMYVYGYIEEDYLKNNKLHEFLT